MNRKLEEELSLLASLSWYTSHFKLSDFLYLSEILKKGESFHSLDRYVSHSDLKQFIQSWIKNGFSPSKKALEWCSNQRINVVFVGHPDYPDPLMREEKPPVVLIYKGKPCWKKNVGLSVVGSRNPSSYSLQWMDEHFAEVLKKRKVLVISGAAQGVDQKAHALSLRAGLPTVCFLPCGLKKIYPLSFKEWERPILESGGALVSAFSPFQEVFKSAFHKRNQWIAAFSNLIFVVEAGRRSGSMMTARLALERGKNICTLPFHPIMERGQGSLDLIFDGAYMLRDDKDLISLVDRYLLNAKRDRFSMNFRSDRDSPINSETDFEDRSL